MSIAAITRLWAVSRTQTERSRDWGETYAVARQEVERDKAIQFKFLFTAPGNRTGTSLISDYNQNGARLATGLVSGAARTTGAMYRAISTYSLVATGTETDNTRKLGVISISVFKWQGTAFSTTPDFRTAVFYTSPGV